MVMQRESEDKVYHGEGNASKSDGKAHPLISVIIATRNRENDIIHCLNNIAKQSYNHYEVIVVDQSEDKGSIERVGKALGEPPWLVTLNSDVIGKSNALNGAFKSSNGELLAFTDDDCEVPPGWLGQISDVFTNESEVDIVVGPVHAGKNMENGSSALYTPCTYFNERRFVRLGEQAGMGANFAMRRRFFELCGGFDVLLGPGAPLYAAEEGDLVYRCQLLGAKVLREPSMPVIHRAWRNRTQWGEVLYSYGVGDAACGLKHLRSGDLRMGGRTIFRAGYIFARLIWRLICRHPHQEQYYLRGFWDGFKTSIRYSVNKNTRIYHSKNA